MDQFDLSGSALTTLSPLDLVEIQKDLQEFFKLVTVNAAELQHIEEWLDILEVQELWTMLRKHVPQLDVRADKVSKDATQLGNMQRRLKTAGLFRPRLDSFSLSEHDARQREQWQDWGYLLFPPFLHRAWHDLVDIEFGVESEYLSTNKVNVYAKTLPHAHRLAFQDRIFMKMCSLWIWGYGFEILAREAFQNFVEIYKQHRTEIPH